MSAGRVFLEALRFDREPPDVLRRRVHAALGLDVGGFLFFGGEADSAARFIEEVREAADRPLWLAADLERGAGQQFRGLSVFPPPAGLAAHGEAETAVREAARGTAREARALGLNLALAPVLDLDVEPRNPIVGTRSFGSDPARVAELGAAWIRSCQQEGVAACAKHFPGHGRTVADSHAGLPVVDAEREALQADLLPFRAVASEVACVMTAHVAYPALGGARPATLEPAIVTRLLRDELDFGGLVLTDALNMAGVREAALAGPGCERGPEETGPAEAAALLAGCDLLLYPPDLVAGIEALERAAGDASAAADRLREAGARSERALGRFAPGAMSASAGAPRGLPDTSETASAAERLAAGCVVPVGGPPPDWLVRSVPISVVAIWDDRDEPGRLPFGDGFRSTLRDAGWTIATAGAPAEGRIVLLAATPQGWKETASVTQTGRAALEGALAGERAFPVVFGHRRLAEELERPGLCAWGSEPAMERAAARRLVELVGEGAR